MRKEVALGGVICGIILFILLSQVSVEDISKAFSQIEMSYLLIGTAIYILAILFRALRFRSVLKEKLGFMQLCSITAIHTSFTSIIPLRLGELSYVYLMKKEGVHASEGLTQLITVRVFDFVAICSLFFVAAIFGRDSPFASYVAVISLFLLVLIALLVLLIVFNVTMISVIYKLNPFRKTSMSKKAMASVEKALSEFASLRNKRKIAGLAIYSFLIWIANYISTYFLMIGLGLDFTFWEVSLILTFLIIIIMLPINALGGFGVIEGGLTGALVASGSPLREAVAVSFAYHIIGIVMAGIVGILGLAGYYLSHFLPRK